MIIFAWILLVISAIQIVYGLIKLESDIANYEELKIPGFSILVCIFMSIYLF